MPASALVAAFLAASLATASPTSVPSPSVLSGPSLPASVHSGPAAPERLSLVAGSTSLSLTWQQPSTGSRARYFEVSEGGAVVARSTTTSAVLRVAFGSTHTYTVTAVDASGAVSPAAGPVTGQAWTSGLNPECFPPSPGPITVTAATASAASLTWARDPRWADLEVRVDGTSLGRTTLTGVRIGGLRPATTYSVGLYRYNSCQGRTVPVAWGSVTTVPGTTGRPGSPSGTAVTGRTDTTIRLTWTPQAGPRPAGYLVYDGDTLVARTGSASVTVRGLYHDSPHGFTVAAVDAAGNESAHTPPLLTATAPCQANPPRPQDLTATVVSASSVRLAWTFRSAAVAYTVFDGDRVVATTAGPDVMVTGLASASRHNLRVGATLPDGCGETARSTAVPITTAPGPAARPAAPSGLTLAGNSPAGTSATVLTLAWSGGPAQSYRVYEGATLAGESPGTGLALTVGAGTWHTYTVVAVDAAGHESAPSEPLSVQAMYLTPP